MRSRKVLFWFSLGFIIVLLFYLKTLDKQLTNYDLIHHLAQERLENISDSDLLRLATYSNVWQEKSAFMFDCTYDFTDGIRGDVNKSYPQCRDAVSEFKKRAALRLGYEPSDITKIIQRYDRYYIINKDVYPDEGISTKENILLNLSKGLSRFKKSETLQKLLFSQTKVSLEKRRKTVLAIFHLQAILALPVLFCSYFHLNEIKCSYYRHRNYRYIRDIYHANLFDCLREATILVFFCTSIPYLSLLFIRFIKTNYSFLSTYLTYFEWIIPLGLLVIGVILNPFFFKLLSFANNPDIIMSNADFDKWQTTKKDIEDFNDREQIPINEDQNNSEPKLPWEG